jgi:hypothetical protein
MVRARTAMFAAMRSRVDHDPCPVVPSRQRAPGIGKWRRDKVQGHESIDAVSAACFY